MPPREREREREREARQVKSIRRWFSGFSSAADFHRGWKLPHSFPFLLALTHLQESISKLEEYNLEKNKMWHATFAPNGFIFKCVYIFIRAEVPSENVVNKTSLKEIYILRGIKRALPESEGRGSDQKINLEAKLTSWSNKFVTFQPF